MPRLNNYSVWMFECNGTLIDRETGIVRALEHLTSQANRLLSRSEILEAHARNAEACASSAGCGDQLQAVYGRLAHEWGVTPDDAAQTAYGRSGPSWPAFPDAATALLYLEKYVRLVALTDVDPDTFAARSEMLAVRFDTVATVRADDAPRSERDWAERLRGEISNLSVRREEILFVTSDSSPVSQAARELGLAICLIDRGRPMGAPPPSETLPGFAFGFANMAELVIAHQDAVRAP